jgi:hypothetical protein
MQASLFGFNIPPSATINNVFVGFKNRVGPNNPVGFLYVELKKDGVGWNVNGANMGVTPTCSDCLDRETEDTAHSWTPDDLNNETFTFKVFFAISVPSVFFTAMCDCVWLRVLYTE